MFSSLIFVCLNSETKFSICGGLAIDLDQEMRVAIFFLMRLSVSGLIPR
jgi:hypothetical protein